MITVDLEKLADALADKLQARLQPERRWLDYEKAAEHLCCSVAQVKRLALDGEFTRYGEGRRTLFSREELDEYVLRTEITNHLWRP